MFTAVAVCLASALQTADDIERAAREHSVFEVTGYRHYAAFCRYALTIRVAGGRLTVLPHLPRLP